MHALSDCYVSSCTCFDATFAIVARDSLDATRAVVVARACRLFRQCMLLVGLAVKAKLHEAIIFLATCSAILAEKQRKYCSRSGILDGSNLLCHLQEISLAFTNKTNKNVQDGGRPAKEIRKMARQVAKEMLHCATGRIVLSEK